MRHPNAVVGGGAGAGLGTLVVFVAGLAGVPLTPELGAVIAGAVTGLALFVGQRGIKGLVNLIWRGGAESDEDVQ